MNKIFRVYQPNGIHLLNIDNLQFISTAPKNILGLGWVIEYWTQAQGGSDEANYLKFSEETEAEGCIEAIESWILQNSCK